MAERRPPDLIGEAPDRLSVDACFEMRAVLQRLWTRPDRLCVDGAIGNGAAWLVCELPYSERLSLEVQVFVRAPSNTAVERAVDRMGELVLLLRDVVNDDKGSVRRVLPLDFEGQVRGDATIFVRGELRDFAAETEAALLLGDDPPPRLTRPALCES